MDRSKAYALCGAIIGVTAIFAIMRGDVAPAAPLFLVAVFFSLRANREWRRENA